jgi:hypothetical protein
MAPKSPPGVSPWQNKYDAALHETDRCLLAKCIEVAEATVLVRLETIKKGANDCAEREAIADALAHLDILKRDRLGFHKYC